MILPSLAGVDRTTETVKDNTDNSNEFSRRWANYSGKSNADDIATLVSAVGTLETDVDGIGY